MILPNLRDRHPEMFAPKPVRKVPNIRWALERARRKRERLENYQRALYMLIYRPVVQAEKANAQS
jgi:hypothetical protein